jgi:cytochrome P450
MTTRFEFRGGESWRDPWPAYRRLREESPVLRATQEVGEDFWVLSRFDDVFDAARDTATFSSARGLTPGSGEMALFEGVAAPIVMMDPPEHTAMRRHVSKAMTPRRVEAIEPMVTAFVDERLDRLADSVEADVMATLFKPLPSFVVGHFLGVPHEDRDRFDGWTDAIVAANAASELGAATAVGDLFAYALELIERRKVEPGADLVSDLVAVGEEEATAMWIVGFVFTMVTGGNDTTSGLLGGAAELLTEHRDQRTALIEDPALIPVAVEEFLRLTSPVQNLARTTTRAVTLHGEVIPEGVKVLLVYGAANRDDREFGTTAEQLDVRRAPARHLALGYGAHHCLGAAAARLQASIALRRLLARFPHFTVDAAALSSAATRHCRSPRAEPGPPRAQVGSSTTTGISRSVFFW